MFRLVADPYIIYERFKAYLVGAGSITDAHCSREHILLEELKTMVDYYYALGEQLIEANK
ncbi:hypothetical protein PsorP6_008171 [Peronosclerospora sorghi]|uniref:Uncharacterized protein n=1 Tax=Peronosclerospora sorghi TaxID=230839 RepID=A0ACC0W9L4_9STRA|nr:hypothetical protein PsorP6_008171 [Peronosclerospora sorghi]